MKGIRYLFLILSALSLAVMLFLFAAMLTDYDPDPQTVVYQDDPAPLVPDSVFTAVAWNIGYAGLDASMDFFYDGGEKVRPGKDGVNNNINGILRQLEKYRTCDFILLQEVDRNSKRSYGIDMYGMIDEELPAHHSAFGMNYKTLFVPLPLKSPMGRVRSGLQTLSAHLPAQVDRHQFPGNYGWPVRLFMLDRCFMVNRYPLSDGKELLVINTHNSANDDGSLRLQQMEYLENFLLAEYEKGNYIVVGGDWNQSPPGFAPGFSGDIFDDQDVMHLEADYPAAGWQWVFDASVPTNRRVVTPYRKGASPTTVIDFFLLSPNVGPVSVQTEDLGFRYSDHHPVKLEFRLQLP